MRNGVSVEWSTRGKTWAVSLIRIKGILRRGSLYLVMDSRMVGEGEVHEVQALRVDKKEAVRVAVSIAGGRATAERRQEVNLG